MRPTLSAEKMKYWTSMVLSAASDSQARAGRAFAAAWLFRARRVGPYR
jgi:hypothetical protein